MRRTFAIVHLNLYPDDLARLVNHINCGMWDAVDLLFFISGIEQAIGVDNFMIRVRKDWKVKHSFSVGGDLVGELLAHVGRIDTNRIESYVLVFLQ